MSLLTLKWRGSSGMASDTATTVSPSSALQKHPTVIQAGFLVKQDTSTQKHSSRWVVLTSDGLLTYFRNGPKASKGRVVPLSSYTACEHVRFYDANAHIFTIYTNENDSYESRTFTFYASTKAEADAWVDNIRKYLKPAAPKAGGSDALKGPGSNKSL